MKFLATIVFGAVVLCEQTDAAARHIAAGNKRFSQAQQKTEGTLASLKAQKTHLQARLAGYKKELQAYARRRHRLTGHEKTMAQAKLRQKQTLEKDLINLDGQIRNMESQAGSLKQAKQNSQMVELLKQQKQFLDKATTLRDDYVTWTEENQKALEDKDKNTIAEYFAKKAELEMWVYYAQHYVQIQQHHAAATREQNRLNAAYNAAIKRVDDVKQKVAQFSQRQQAQAQQQLAQQQRQQQLAQQRQQQEAQQQAEQRRQEEAATRAAQVQSNKAAAQSAFYAVQLPITDYLNQHEKDASGANGAFYKTQFGHLENWLKVAKAVQDHYLKNAEKIEAGDAEAKQRYAQLQHHNEQWAAWVNANVFNAAAPQPAVQPRLTFEKVMQYTSKELLAEMDRTLPAEFTSFENSLSEQQKKRLVMKLAQAYEDQERENNPGPLRQVICA